jgi:hypothetical protein
MLESGRKIGGVSSSWEVRLVFTGCWKIINYKLHKIIVFTVSKEEYYNAGSNKNNENSV